MIADLDETIRQLLIKDLPVKNGEIIINFDQPKREWSAKLTKPTVNFFLYDVRENVELRQAQFERVLNGNSREAVAKLKKLPKRIDCFYMLTTWAAEPEDEHRLLTRALMSLFRYPILPEHLLVGTLQHPSHAVQTHVARHDKLTNPAEVWSALDNEMRPSISFTVTLTLDPWTEFTAPIVRTLTFRAGQSTSLPTYQQLDEGAADPTMTFIGGTIVSKGKEQIPQAGLEVAIKGTGHFARTDNLGRFRLGTIPPGEYTLVVWPEKGKPTEKKINVPADVGEYDVEM